MHFNSSTESPNCTIKLMSSVEEKLIFVILQESIIFFFIENFWKDLPLQKMSTHNPFVYDLLVSKRSVDIHFIVVLFWFIFINFSLVNDYYSKFVISDQILT